MSLFQKRRAETLSEWLEIATHRLAAPAKERIRAEIEAHYSTAVEQHRENDLSEFDAQAASLAELGDANEARRRFRKGHLAEWESQIVKLSIKQGRSIVGLISCYAIFTCFVFDQLPLPRNALIRSRFPLLFLFLEFIVLIAFPTVSFIVARPCGTKPNVRNLLLMQSVSGFWYGMALNQLFMPVVYPVRFPVTLLLCLEALAMGLVDLHVWDKLGKVIETRDKLPPPNTAQG